MKNAIKPVLMCCAILVQISNVFSQEKDNVDLVTDYPFHAEVKGEVVKYAIIENIENDSFGKVYTNLDLEAGVGLANITFNLSADAVYKHPSFMAGLKYAHGYPDIAIAEITKNVKRTPYRNAEGNLIYLFKTLQKDDKTPVPINGAGAKPKSIRVPVIYNVQYGVRAGYQFIEQRIGGIRNSAPIGSAMRLTAIQSQNLYIGFSKVNSSNVRINAKQYGLCTKSGFQHMYFDVMYSPMITGEFYRPATPKFEAVNNVDFRKNPFGFRFGIEEIQSTDKFSNNIGIEVGMRPGYAQVYNFYMMAKIGHGLSF